MERRIKKVLTFVIPIFLVATACYIIIFALGYKIDWNNFKIEQTGMISAKTNPSQANLYLDGQYVKKTPARIRWLFPGNYKVRLSKENYFDFEKEVEVTPGLVTEIKGIKLFKKDPKRQRLGQARQLEMVDNKSGYMINDKKIIFFAIEPQKRREVISLDKKISSYRLSSNLDKVIINQEKVFDLKSGKRELKLDKKYPKYNNFRFRPQNPDWLIASKKKALYLINLSSKEEIKLIDKSKTKSFALANDFLYFIQKTKKSGYQLKKLDYSSLKEEVIAQKEIICKQKEGNLKVKISSLKLKLTSQNDIYLADNQNINYFLENSSLIRVGENISSISKGSADQYLFTTILGEIVILNNPTDEDKRSSLLPVRLSTNNISVKRLNNSHLLYKKQGQLYVVNIYQQVSWPINSDLKIDQFFIYNSDQIIIKAKNNKIYLLKIS